MTPDSEHIEQVLQIVRFMVFQWDCVKIKEAFIDFISQWT